MISTILTHSSNEGNQLYDISCTHRHSRFQLFKRCLNRSHFNPGSTMCILDTNKSFYRRNVWMSEGWIFLCFLFSLLELLFWWLFLLGIFRVHIKRMESHHSRYRYKKGVFKIFYRGTMGDATKIFSDAYLSWVYK